MQGARTLTHSLTHSLTPSDDLRRHPRPNEGSLLFPTPFVLQESMLLPVTLRRQRRRLQMVLGKGLAVGEEERVCLLNVDLFLSGFCGWEEAHKVP